MSRTTTLAAVWILAASCPALVGCDPGVHGIIAAAKTGDLLEPPATRVDPLAEVRTACGAPSTPSATLTRRPYVQSVSSARAVLTWTSTAADAETVEIWVPGGEPRGVEPSLDATRYLAGAAQRSAALDALAPSTLHCYALVDAGGQRAFGPAGFRTAPERGTSGAASDEAVDIVVIGDSGGANDDQRAVAAQLRTVPADFMLHVGDVAYNEGTLGQLETNHFAVYEPLQSTVPLFPAIGDHDDVTDAAGPWREVFTVPENGAAERSYSFDWGPVHVVVLDAYAGDAQRDWLDRDLAATVQPWRIAVIHEPPYSSGWHGSSARIRDGYCSIFERHGVQLVLSGDDHDYERSVPIRGVTYVVTGGGGANIRPVGTSEWTAFSETVFHFTYVSVQGDVMRLHAIDGTGREFDGVEIPLAL